jgi:hypothetical protein
MLRTAISTYGDAAAQQESDGSGGTVQKSEAGVYGGASGWADAITIVGDLSGGTGGLATVAYTSEPLTYIHSLLPLYGPEVIDSALSHVPGMRQALLNMAANGALPAQWNDNHLIQELSLVDLSAYLGNHHMYGSARLGIASYQPGQHEYRWDYLHGITDTFGMSRPRPWYSWALNAPVKAGATSPYAGGLDSTAEGSHVIGMKQYELTNHLGNVQETVSDNKFDKDVNGDGLRDEYRAASVSVYDYYPFGMLMPGRVVLDTAGRCITLTRDYTVLINHWRNGGALFVSGGMTGGATAFGNATRNQSSSYSNGATAYGTSGGMLFTISNITSYSISLKLFFSMLAGTTQVRVYAGADTTGVQLGSMNVNYTSPAAVLNLSGVTSPSNGNADITVVVSKAPGTGVHEYPVDLFSLDSLGYNYATYGLEYGLFTQCNSLSDKYEFGYNGQMKMNEIAGIGNHNSALFWEYSPQIGRRWNLDPVKSPSLSLYSAFNSNPIFNTDRLGNVGEPVVKEGTLTIYSNVVFYGGAATPKRAEQAAKNMQSAWTNAHGSVTFKGVEYHDVKFVVTAKVVTERQAKSMAAANKGDNYDPRLNFARIESAKDLPANAANQVAGRASGGDNSMLLIAEDIRPENTSQAHEMGHGYGLTSHESSFKRFNGQPSIMTTIQTAVDGQYTVTGKDGVPQGPGKLPINVLNTDCRQVTAADVNNTNVNKYATGHQGQGVGNGYRVGNSSNVLFDSDGNPIPNSEDSQGSNTQTTTPSTNNSKNEGSDNKSGSQDHK